MPTSRAASVPRFFEGPARDGCGRRPKRAWNGRRYRLFLKGVRGAAWAWRPASRPPKSASGTPRCRRTAHAYRIRCIRRPRGRKSRREKLFGAMKPGSNSKRSRGRGNPRRPNNGPRTQVFESNGPDTRIRGTVNQVLEKYLALARDASSSGDYVSAENYFQHAEHYYRILSANGGSHGGLQRFPGQPGQGPAPQPQRPSGEQGRPQGQPQQQGPHGVSQPQGGNGSSVPVAAPGSGETDSDPSDPTPVSS